MKEILIQGILLAEVILQNDQKIIIVAVVVATLRNASNAIMIIVNLVQKCYDELVRHSHFSWNNPYQNTQEITVIIVVITRYCNNKSCCCCYCQWWLCSLYERDYFRMLISLSELKFIIAAVMLLKNEHENYSF